MSKISDVLRNRQGVATVDGFLSGSGQRPRQPRFRGDDLTAKVVRKSAINETSQNNKAANTRKNTKSISLSTPSQTKGVKPSPVGPRDNFDIVDEFESPKPKKQKKEKSGKGKIWFKRIIKTIGLLLLVAIIAFGVRFAQDVAKTTGDKNPFAMLSVLQRAPLKNDNGRVNILVAGNSADDIGHNGAKLTDSIMVLSMDTKKKTAMMLSIPRDLWVKIPSKGYSKINAAYTYGGMTTLVGVIEDNLELKIHYTALVNYTAFKDLVDAVGGITITINSSDKRGIYDSSLDWTSAKCCALAKYPNGPVTLNGKQALNLARARGDGRGSYGFPGTDFTRTEHQRMMLLAVREKAMSSATLSNPLKISNLVSAVGKNVTTDIQLKEIQSLYSYIKEIDVNNIDSYNLNDLKGENTTMLSNYTTPEGQSALIPAAGLSDYSDITAQIQLLFTAGPVVKEAARIVVLNGTDTVGLARSESAKLTEKGMTVVAQGNATTQPATTYIDKTGGKKPATVSELKSIYNATVVTDQTISASYPNADVILILGQSAVPTPSQDETADQ